VKYGALSVPAGRVDVSWRRLGDAVDGAIDILWTEERGPVVAPPARRGFGSLVIERNLTRTVDAEVTLTFAQEGVSCRIILPASHVLATR